MKKYIIKSKLIKLTLLSLVAIGSVSGVYLTYHQPAPIQVATESPQNVEISEPVPPFVVKPELIKTPEEVVEKQVDELVVNRKIAIASLEVPSRSKAATVVEQKAVEAAVKEEVNPAEQKSSPEEDNSKYDTTLNSYVLSIIKTYSPGRYPYLLNNDYANYNGVTFNISYQDKLLLKANPSGNRASHCSGITFEVFFRAMQERNKKLGLPLDDFNGMTYDQMHNFVLSWYVADGDKQAQNAAKAVEKYGLGRRITSLEDARAGDFIDLSRENNTGHTVVFINWLKDNGGKIIGLTYWSSQASTQGISYKEEYFNIPNAAGEKYGNVMMNYLFIARVSAVKDYR